MAIYKIISEDRNILADQAFVDQVYPNDYEFIAEEVIDTIELPKILTKLEYMNRFTNQELEAIYTLAKTNVQVEIWLERFKLAANIDLNDPQVESGLMSLESIGVLAPGRIAEILA